MNAERQRLKEATASSEEKDRTIEDLRRQIEEAQKINREAKELQATKSKPSEQASFDTVVHPHVTSKPMHCICISSLKPWSKPRQAKLIVPISKLA